MSQQINDNFKLNAGKPIDSKYLNLYNEPYNSTAEANSLISMPERYSGLTINVGGVEYWYKDGVSNTDLIEKIYGTTIPTANYVTGATNLGFFSGYTGIQVLPISHLTKPEYSGNYNSMYNYYYRGSDGAIHVGIPNDGVPKRGYLRSNEPKMSWIWNEYTGGTDMLGWTLVNGDISTLIGTFQYSSVPQYYNGTTKLPFTVDKFDTGSSYSSSADLGIAVVTGSLTTGVTTTIGGRIYANKTENKLNLKSIISVTPNTIHVFDDESFVRISGATITYNIQNTNVGGLGIYKNTCNNTFYLKRLIASGSTTLVEEANRIVICGEGGINTGYNGYSPTSISVGGIVANTNITGKPVFQLMEDLLSPTLYPTFTSPSACVRVNVEGHEESNVFETGYRLEQAVSIAWLDRGCIAPQYNALYDKRSGCSHWFEYGGTVFNGGFCNTADECDVRDISTYRVVEGIQSVDVSICYLAGTQPYNNRGCIYSTPLQAGVTSKASAILCGVLPWYWGVSDSSTVDANCIINCGYCGRGGKCVDDVNGNTLEIDYNMSVGSAPKYLWFAVPNCSDLRTSWKINDGNMGSIGGIGNLYSTPVSRVLTSENGYWEYCNYELYVSCYPTKINNEIICIK